MNERIQEKIKQIESFWEQLATIVPGSFDEYQADFKAKAACERYAEKIIEAMVDLAFLVVRERKLGIPEDDKDVFGLLVKNQIVPPALAERLHHAKGMRNILVHEYGEIDDAIVYEAIKEKLEDDVNAFLTYIQRLP